VKYEALPKHTTNYLKTSLQIVETNEVKITGRQIELESAESRTALFLNVSGRQQPSKKTE
jgi:hypothetical protein